MAHRRGQKVRRGREFWEVAVRRWQESGQSVAVFCSREGLAVSTFCHWRQRLGPTVGASTALVPVGTVSRDLLMRERSPFEVMLHSGHVVRVPADFDEGALVRLVVALECRRC